MPVTITFTAALCRKSHEHLLSVWGEEPPETKPNFHSPLVADKHLQAFHHDIGGMEISLFICLFFPHECVTLEGD